MKNILKLSLVSLCASGAFFSTTQLASANDQQASDSRSDKQLVITEPAGADISASASTDTSLGGGATIRTSNLIGEKVVDSSGKRCGKVKDALVDLNSGRLAFLVVDSRGRMVAVPSGSFQAQGDQIMLNIDRDRLSSAPQFSYNDLNSSAWASQTYSFYGRPSYWQSGQVSMAPSWQSSAGFQSQSTIQPGSGFYEAAGAQIGSPRMVTGRDQDCYADCLLHKYQLGKGAARATDEQYWNNISPDHLYAQYPSDTGFNNYSSYSYNSGSSYSTAPSASAGFYSSGPGASAQVTAPSSGIISESAGASSGPTLYRSSDLVGMHVRASNGQDLGEIRDVVVDLNSGRVAYAVLAPTGTEFHGKFLAIPPAAFTRGSTDQHILTLNMDSAQLANAPSFQPNNWPQPQNQTFITEVYNFYHVNPYWQGQQGGDYEHHRMHHEGSTTTPRSSDQNLNQGSQQGSIQGQGSFQGQASAEQNLNQSSSTTQSGSSVTEPSGTSSSSSTGPQPGSSGIQSSDQSQSQPQSGAPQSSTSGSLQSDQSAQSSSSSLQSGKSGQTSSTVTEPSGAEQNSATQPATKGNQSTTELKGNENAGAQNEAQPGTQTSTSTSVQDQSGNQAQTSTTTTTGGQGMSERVRSTLHSDTTLSPMIGNVTFSDQNGKVALNGTVKSEAEKQQIVSKAEETAGSGNVIDNLQVKSDNSNP